MCNCVLKQCASLEAIVSRCLCESPHLFFFVEAV